MGKIKTVELTKAHRSELEKGYRAGSSHAFRVRCQMILLKSERRTAKEIADLLGCCEVVVNNWLKRYEVEGIEGLLTKPGQRSQADLGCGKGFAECQGGGRRQSPTESAWRRPRWRQSWASPSAPGRLSGI